MKTVRSFASQVAALLLSSVLAAASLAVHAEPEAGWWWNPAEPGRGFFLEIQGSRLFLAGYLYESDGRATWVVSNDPMPSENAYTGRLLSVSGGQSLVGEYRAPSALTDIGQVTLAFTDRQHGTLTWAGGTVPIQRQPFRRGEDADDSPVAGWWWNPSESGRGFSIEMQGDHMFVGAYMYDAAGNPVWYVADGFMTSPTVFRGPLLRFSNGQTMAGPHRAPTSSVAGAITIEFDPASPDSARVTLSDEPPLQGEIEKTGKIINVRPQRLEVPRVPIPAKLRGNFGQTIHFDDVVITADIAVTARDVVWTQTEIAGLRGTDYEISASSVEATMRGIIPCDGDPVCEGGSRCVDDESGTGKANGLVTLLPDGRYRGHIRFNMTTHGTICRTPTSTTFPVNIPLKGVYVYAQMQGEPSAPGNPSMTSRYRFTAE